MPNYKRPGVFVEETLNPLVTPLSVPGVAPAAFVGYTTQGTNTRPVQVSSWQQYLSRFGGFGDGTNLLPFAVYQYFNNGGNNAYIVRAARADAVKAKLTLNNRAGTPAALLALTAENPGSWGNNLYVQTSDTGASGSGRFDVTLYLNGSTPDKVVERWVDASMNPADARYFVSLVNANPEDGGSSYVKAMNLRGTSTTNTTLSTATIVGATALTVVSSTNFVVGQSINLGTGTANAETVIISAIPDATHLTVSATTNTHAIGDAITTGVAYTVQETPAVLAATALTSGSDGSGIIDLVTQTKLLADVPDNVNVNLPGVNDTTTINAVISFIEGMTNPNMFLVVDVPPANSGATASATATAYSNLTIGGSAFTASSYCAVYGPWLRVKDPASAVSGATRNLPPGGAVLGVYAVTDASRGVAKAPGGIGARISGLLDVETRFASADLDTLNQNAINVIRAVPGAGFCIMGARTLLTGFPTRYIPIRRTLMSIKKSVIDGIAFAILEPNTPGLWGLIKANLEQYLTSLMQVGVLAGNTPQEAFYVVCDATNNLPQSVAGGIVNVEVGVSLETPAEFIVIRIGQYDGATNAVEV